MHDSRYVATVRVQHPDVEGETMLVNAVDYNPDVHVLAEQPHEHAIAAVKSLWEERQALEARAERTARGEGHLHARKPTGVHNASVPPRLVRVVHPDVDGLTMLINASEFDASIHTLVEAQRASEAGEPEKTPEKTPENPPAPDADAIAAELRAQAQRDAEAAVAADAQAKADAEKAEQAAKGRSRGKQS